MNWPFFMLTLDLTPVFVISMEIDSIEIEGQIGMRGDLPQPRLSSVRKMLRGILRPRSTTRLLQFSLQEQAL